MNNVTAILSMLHESKEQHSGARCFRGQSVLAWTLERLGHATGIEALAVLCWEDQLSVVEEIAESRGAYVLAKGPRQRLASVEAIAAAQRWSDGWRSGLLNTCDFDQGFYGPWIKEIADKLESEAVLFVDPASGLIDPYLVDGLIDWAETHGDRELFFSPAAPGLGAVLLRPGLLEKLSAANTHPGKVMHYLPDHPVHDPCSTDACLPVPTPVARTTHRFKLDSDRQIARIQHATVSLNGELITSPAEEIVQRTMAAPLLDVLPREVVLELTTRRATRPIFKPATHLRIDRAEFSLELARKLFHELSAMDDMRLTLAGVGDPLLHPQVFQIIEAAHAAGITAIHLETDLLDITAEQIALAAEAPLDVVSVHIPACSESTYKDLMGTDGLVCCLENIRLFLTERQKRGRRVPILVPTFVKCRQNLGEMEAWYDTWLRALSCAVIRGPSTFGGKVPDCAVADMSPPRRRPCARLNSRMTILSTGQVAACEEDVLGAHVVGEIGSQSIKEIWRDGLDSLRAAHASGAWNRCELCSGCSEWHRP